MGTGALDISKVLISDKYDHLVISLNIESLIDQRTTIRYPWITCDVSHVFLVNHGPGICLALGESIIMKYSIFMYIDHSRN